MKTRFSQISMILGLLTLAFCFQNCSRGFNALLGENNDVMIQKSPGVPGEDPLLKLLADVDLSELQSVFIPLDGKGELSFPDGLPKGLVYQSGLRQLSWIPTRGQAGSYQLKVQEDGVEKGLVRLRVAAVSDNQLKIGGPPFLYRDGDIGYIFVHGAGDVDRCTNPADLAAYWGAGPAVVAPDATNRTIVCYDSREAVANVARSVANQILASPCGRLNRCVIFTHSMGGLLMEHILLHIREAQPSDPVPQMYTERILYQAVKERTLFVVSLASAAGGSKAASIVNSQGMFPLTQEAIGSLTRIIGFNDNATRNLAVPYASNIVAPYLEDPGVPFFMIAGFTEKTLAEESGFLGGVFNVTLNNIPLVVFNGDRGLATVDSLALYNSRSDGLVDLRSACGVASDREDDGPGRSVSLEEHFRYCWNSPKKANHFVWFLSNLNHVLIPKLAFNCRNATAPCVALFPNPVSGTFSMDAGLTGLSAMEIARRKLADTGPQILGSLAVSN
jgi:hypothetical protein